MGGLAISLYIYILDFVCGEGQRTHNKNLTPEPPHTQIQAIEAVISEELQGWSVHEKVHVSYAELHDALSRIRRRLEGPRGITRGELPLLRFVVGAFCVFWDVVVVMMMCGWGF